MKNLKVVSDIDYMFIKPSKNMLLAMAVILEESEIDYPFYVKGQPELDCELDPENDYPF